MKFYIPYLIFIALSAIILIVALIVNGVRKKKEKVPGNSRLIVTVGIITALYFVIKIFFGWRLTNWYVEAGILLVIFIYFDYLIVIKKQYNSNIISIYYFIRFSSFGLPLASFVLLIIFGILTLTFGFQLTCFIFPLDHSYGEQQVYKNLYIYNDDCSHTFRFKKKILFFEKDITSIGRTGSFSVFAGFGHENNPTGFVHQRKDTIYITGDKKLKDHTTHLRIVILSPKKLKIETVDYEGNPGSLQKIIEL